MGDVEYEKLCDSIKLIGLQDKIILKDGKILDGNNRYTACLKVRVKPEFEELAPGKDPLQFVLQKNLARRNLNPSQLAAIGAELLERMNPKAGRPAGKVEDHKETRSKVTQVSKALNVSKRSVRKASAVKREDPQAFQEVRAGSRSLNSAAKQATAKQDAKQAASDEFDAAITKIAGWYDADLVSALKGGKRLKPKEVIELASLDKSEAIRIKPLIASGWKLSAARGYKVVALTAGHTIRNLVDRAMAQGSIYCLTLEVNKRQAEITVRINEANAT